MKNRSFLVMVLLLGAAPAFGAEAMNDRLQKGLFEEEANQNLDAAIAAYQGVIAAHEEERKLAATALFRLGECYRKLGRTNEAAAHYQRLLHDFSDQSTLARLSEQNLFDLGMPRDTTVPRTPEGRGLVELLRRDLNGLKVTQAQEKAALFLYSNDFVRAQRLREEKIISQPQMDAAKSKYEQAVAVIQQRESSIADLERSLLELPRQDSAGPANERAGQRTDGITSAGSNVVSSLSAHLAAAKRDAERAEIQRLEALVKESPDLVNTSKGGVPPPLHSAIQQDQIEVARFLLEHGADVELANSQAAAERSFAAPLMMAVKKGNRAMVELLLQHGAEVNVRDASGNTALMAAAGSGFKAISELLLTKGADLRAVNRIDQTALHRAVLNNRKEIVELLLAHNADVNARGLQSGTPLLEAVGSGSVSLARLLLSKGASVGARGPGDSTPLSSAVSNENEAMVELLLAHHADPNVRFRAEKLRTSPDSPASGFSRPMEETVSGFTPLLLAAYLGNAPITQRLLQAGADANARAADGTTALLWAVRRDRREVMQLLVSAGANPNLGSDYETPLGAAVRMGRIEPVRLLLDQGADPMKAEFHYGPPLHSAVVNGHRAVMELLLERGADIQATDDQGRTALDMAKLSAKLSIAYGPPTGVEPRTIQGPELITELRRHGANEFVPRAGVITLCRVSRSFSQPIFFKGTNDFNHHTLTELIWAAYQGDQSRSTERGFPDLAGVRLSRRDPRDGTVHETKIDLVSILASGDPARDVPLQWGDVIEVPELDHGAQEAWTGFARPDAEALTKLLTRQVVIVVKGETNRVTLEPIAPFSGSLAFGGTAVMQFGSAAALPPPGAIGVPFSPIPGGGVPLRAARPVTTGIPGAFPGGTAAPVAAGEPVRAQERKLGALTGFRLLRVLYAANVLRVSSDLSKVKVTRIDAVTHRPQAIILNYAAAQTNYDEARDLWLRDGDFIEVPEK